MQGLEEYEPPTHGLGNHFPTVLPVRNRLFSIGSDVSYSGPITQVGHEYAPQNAPHHRSGFQGQFRFAPFTERQCDRGNPSPIASTGRPYAPYQAYATSPPESVASSTGFVRFKHVFSEVRISKRRLKQLEAVHLIRGQREKAKQELAYNARPFILCGIALRRPPLDQLMYSRRSGKFFLRIIGHPDFGLPFGQDRLIPIWVATLALRQKSRTVMLETAAEMLEFFKLAPDGYHYHRLIQGFKRAFSATIFFGTGEHPDGRAMIDWARFHFFDQMKLWFDPKKPVYAGPGRANGNVITISESFYREIDAHRIPVERHVVGALAHAPGILDFYLWIVWKSWTVKGREVRVPLTGPGGLSLRLGQGNTPGTWSGAFLSV